MQQRNHAGGPWLSPARDLAHNVAPIFEMVGDRLEDGQWDALVARCEQEGVSADDLGEACRVYIETLANPHGPGETLEGRLRQFGWFDLPEMAQISIMATIGTVILGMQYAGILHASIDEANGGPVQKIEPLIEAGRDSAKLIAAAGLRKASETTET